MNRYVFSVLGAGICWGFMGFFTRHLYSFGIGTDGAIIIRCLGAALAFLIVILIKDRSLLKIRMKDIWCFIGSGLLSLLFFTFCYFNAISMMSLSAAAILLYIAPSVVTLLSVILFKERLTPIKIFSVLLAFAGCCLVSGITGGLTITAQGILFGIGSGVGYALYTIFSRYSLERGYSSLTINFYSCLLAGLGAMIIWHPATLVSSVTSSAGHFLFCIAAAVVTCFIPYLLYTYGLTGLENGKASVLASVEPVVASLVGILIYKETYTFMSVTGVVMVLAAVVLLNIKPSVKT